MNRPVSSKGTALVTVMMVTLLLVILTTSLVIVNMFNLSLMGRYRDRVAAAELGQAGLNHLLTALTTDMGSTGDIDSKTLTPYGYYEITFNKHNPENKYFSVNSLTSATTVSPNFRGESVPAETADVVITARVNSVIRRFHVIIRKGIKNEYALTSIGKIELQGDCTIDGIKSLSGPGRNIRIPGKIHSNYKASAGDQAISWDHNGSFTINEGGLVSCVSSEDVAHPVADEIRTAVTDCKGTVNERHPDVAIPDIDIDSTVNDAIDSDIEVAPFMSHNGNNYVADGEVQIRKGSNRCINGNYEIVGDLTLNDATLYVKGNLKVTGAIRGTGSIYVTGTTEARGDTSIVTNKETGTTIFSGGDVTFTGIDARGYLDTLASIYPKVNTALDKFETSYQNLQEACEEENLDEIFDWCVDIGQRSEVKAADKPDHDYININVKAPDGSMPQARDDRKLMALILSIKSSLGSSYDSNKQAQHVVGALEKMCYTFRSGLRYLDEAKLQPRWDDEDIFFSPAETSFDRQYRLANTDESSHPAMFPDGVTLSTAQFADNVKAYMDTHPLDMEWTGKNYFQGVVYTRGNLNVSNAFEVIGTVMVKKDVKLTGGSKLTYDEEYCNVVGAGVNYLSPKLWEEL